VPIDLRDGPARPVPAAPDAGRPIRLLTAFNLGSTLTRKNPAAAIAVFERVRAAARQDVSLTIKIGKIGNFPERYVDFLKLDTKQDGINVIVTDLSEPDFGTLIDAHDMYISMHRAEGLGLPLAQAMWRGKIAVATAWSGNLEFMTPASSILVDCAPTTMTDENRNTDAELPCAEPSVDDAANKILEILEDRERMAEMGRLAQRRISEVSQFAVDYNRRRFCSSGTPVQE
jgi:glycosyltransferase involved in cell wall biosynthesis